MDHSVGTGLPLGFAASQNLSQRYFEPGNRCAPSAQIGLSRAAGGSAAKSRGRDLCVQLAFGYGHEPAADGSHLRISAGTRSDAARKHLRAYPLARALVAIDDRRDAGAGIQHAIWRAGCDNGVGLCEHRDVISLLLADLGVVGRRSYGQRYLIERALRQSTANYRPTAWRLARAGRSLE